MSTTIPGSNIVITSASTSARNCSIRIDGGPIVKKLFNELNQPKKSVRYSSSLKRRLSTSCLTGRRKSRKTSRALVNGPVFVPILASAASFCRCSNMIVLKSVLGFLVIGLPKWSQLNLSDSAIIDRLTVSSGCLKKASWNFVSSISGYFSTTSNE